MTGQLGEEPRLLIPRKRVGQALVVVRKQLDLGRCPEPSEPVLVHPFCRCEVQDAPDHLEPVIDGAGRDTILAALRHPRIERASMEPFQRDLSNMWE
jgi:hypothetical protein